MLLQLENTKLIQDLTQQTEEARAARAAAEQAGLAKSRFLAAASHDLRQPIHAQGLFLDVLSRTRLDAQQLHLVDGIHAASQASAEMLHSLLDFSRIDAGVVLPRVCAFRVLPVLNKIEREFGPQADAKGLSYRSRECSLVVRSDPALVELILRNLVANAIRYTEHGGLLVACRERHGKAVFEIWDTGIGIAPEHQQDVFLEFHQLGNPQRDRRNGLGLGLAIVKALAQTLDHPLSLKSTVGKGSVFRVEVPIAQGGATLTEPVSSDLLRVELFKVRVLVLDDDEVVLQSMLHLLRDWGCECEGAQDIAEAVSMALKLRPQVIVSDYRLREQHTGVQAIEAVRAALGIAVPALLITGDTAPERIREAVASGLPLFHKPISPAQLYRGLVAALPEGIGQMPLRTDTPQHAIQTP
jgi:CheY-like chemotaxis protein